MSERPRMLVQIVGSAAILAFVPGNVTKLVAFVIWWAVTFRRLSRKELLAGGAAMLLFTVMDFLTLRQGIFRFNHPDFLLMPCYEPLLWGYLLLHTMRMVGGPAPPRRTARALALAVLFSAPFLLLTDPTLLLASSAVLLLGALALFHEPLDLAYTGYMLLVGVLWEHTGVWSGQWSYPGTPLLGVPLWFAPMFGGIGLFARRLVLPLLTDDARERV